MTSTKLRNRNISYNPLFSVMVLNSAPRAYFWKMEPINCQKLQIIRNDPKKNMNL